MTRRRKKFLWLGCLGLTVTALGVALWIRRFHTYTPMEAILDLRAAAAVRQERQGVPRFMEIRYGPMDVSANREKAFLDFFNVGHIEGLHILVQRTPPEYRQASIQGMADWVAQYRRTLTSQEKASLAAYLNTKAGRHTVEQATAKYLSHDVQYRAMTAPVITELMATLAVVSKP